MEEKPVKQVGDNELLVVVIDTVFNEKLLHSDEDVVQKSLDALTIFCNSHLMLSTKNEVAIIAAHLHKSCYVYPSDNDEEVRLRDGQYEKFAQVSRTVFRVIKDIAEDGVGKPVRTLEPLLTGGLSLALSYINRKMKEHEAMGNPKLLARILVFSASGDSAEQYLNLMNMFFAAQRMNVMVDACVIDRDSGLLQQGSDITGGMYLKITKLDSLLEYLLWVFLGDKKTRQKLVLPKASHVDYRTACFCHGNLIEIGYVCSVCLSIFCAFSPICTTCQTHFKFMATIPPMKRKAVVNGTS